MESDAVAKAHEALKLFSTIERSGVFDDKDAERLAVSHQTSEGGKKPSKTAVAAPQSAGAAKRPNPGVDEAIMTKLHRRNKELVAEVEALKLQLSGAPAPAAGQPASSGGAHGPQAALSRAETRLLQKQLSDLRTVNLRSIDNGEATGKVNKEVKDFFHLSRQKMLEDSAALEVERSLWNAALLAAEDSL
jgi:hypothetical protein